jgi:hypothetical protein
MRHDCARDSGGERINPYEPPKVCPLKSHDIEISGSREENDRYTLDWCDFGEIALSIALGGTLGYLVYAPWQWPDKSDFSYRCLGAVVGIMALSPLLLALIGTIVQLFRRNRKNETKCMDDREGDSPYRQQSHPSE